MQLKVDYASVLLVFFTMLSVIHAYHAVTSSQAVQSALIQPSLLSHSVQAVIRSDSFWSTQQHANRALKLAFHAQAQQYAQDACQYSIWYQSMEEPNVSATISYQILSIIIKPLILVIPVIMWFWIAKFVNYQGPQFNVIHATHSTSKVQIVFYASLASHSVQAV